MTSYARFGPYISSDLITSDPFGNIHRGLAFSGKTFERHVLIRTFSPELLEAGISSHLDKTPSVRTERALGSFAMAGKTPLVVFDDLPGRSLAQVISKAKQENLPFGLDQALAVLSGLAQAILDLHSTGKGHGSLSPHSIWLSYEGTIHLWDAPYASFLKSLFPKSPLASAAMAPYRPTESSATALDQDHPSEPITLESTPGTRG
jgi:serine/threonine protein kinase